MPSVSILLIFPLPPLKRITLAIGFSDLKMENGKCLFYVEVSF
ncbi:MAG: hypothetical protein Rpha_0457 [Candidatus Ruthia sp. Apha_13_S6]|nr:hypothetical protein [Candidatus Ruthia sp. Apha_13_S6]